MLLLTQKMTTIGYSFCSYFFRSYNAMHFSTSSIKLLYSSPIAEKVSLKLFMVYFLANCMAIASSILKPTSVKSSKIQNSLHSFGKPLAQQLTLNSIKHSKIWQKSIQRQSPGCSSIQKPNTGLSSTFPADAMVISHPILQNLSIHGSSKLVRNLFLLCLSRFVTS